MINRKIIYGLLVVLCAFSLITYSTAQTSSIPIWVKNVAGFWSNDEISDQEFISAIQFLLDDGILKLTSEESDNTALDKGNDNESGNQIENENQSTNLDLITFKVVKLQELAENPTIIQAVIDSNSEFSSMDDPYQYTIDKDVEWKKQPKNENSPFMNALSENHIADILKQYTVIPTEEFGDVLFPELIVTNSYGANVAITGRTDDYNQGDEVWWIKAIDRQVHFRDVSWDESAGIFSADIVVQIQDQNGRFIGVLNAATPVR